MAARPRSVPRWGYEGGACPWRPLLCEALAQERQNALRGLVGLREHARAGLLQDLELGELDHLRGHVHVADPALGRHQVLLVGREVVEAMLEAVLQRAKVGTLARHVRDRAVERAEGDVRETGRAAREGEHLAQAAVAARADRACERDSGEA